MLGFWNYTVYLTYAGLLSSVIGMSLAMGEHSIGAVVCLLVSGGCDMFDGKIARTKKDRTAEEKAFGIQIDSLCDIVCFGVFPAVLGFTLGADRPWQMAVAALFVLCGVVRLAYFNVTEEIRQSSTSEKRHTYSGLPITASAFFVPLLMCFAGRLENCLDVVYSLLLVLMGFFYIAPVNVKKPGFVGGVILVIAGAAILIANLT